MSEAAAVQPVLTGKEASLKAGLAKMQAEYGEGPTTEETDTDGTPEDTVESEAETDDGSATEGTDDEDSDTDDGTPEDEAEGDDGYEQRFKDTQAKLTETAQELSRVRQEQAEVMAEYKRQSFELQDKFKDAEQLSGFLAQAAQSDLARLQQVNPQTLNQQQFAQWQQELAYHTQKAQGLYQTYQQAQARAKEVHESALTREAAVSREYLVRAIDNFDAEYPLMGQFAESQGISSSVFREITDPGLIKLIHRVMKSESQEDVIEKVVKKTKAVQQKSKNLTARDDRGRFLQADKAFRTAKTPQERQQAYLAREAQRYEKEYRR